MEKKCIILSKTSDSENGSWPTLLDTDRPSDEHAKQWSVVLMTADIRFVNGSILTVAGLTSGNNGIAVSDGQIRALGRTDTLPSAETTIDVDGAIIAPGIVDEHVHDRSLGQRHKENWTTLTRAAAAGGATTVLGHGNTEPFVDAPEHIERKLERASRNALVDFGCFAWVTPNNYDGLKSLSEAGAVGFQASLAERALDSGQLLTAMEYCATTDSRLGLHVEDGTVIDDRTAMLREAGADAPTAHGRVRPPVAERTGAGIVVELARETGCPIHVFQVSTGSALEHLERGKRAGVDMTVETCPHYLWFTEEAVAEQGSVAVVSPPLRSEAEQTLLWERGITGGLVDCLGTDHAPHTDEEKHTDNPFDSLWDVWHGFVGLETAVPAMLTLIEEGRLTYSEWIRMHSTAPAKTWGLYPQKGSLQVGTDADLVIVDPDCEWTAASDRLHSKGTVTPFDGTTFSGRVKMTVLGGELIYHDGTVLGSPGDGTNVTA